MQEHPPYSILDQIRAACAERELPPTTLMMRAIGNPNLVSEIERRGGCTSTASRYFIETGRTPARAGSAGMIVCPQITLPWPDRKAAWPRVYSASEVQQEEARLVCLEAGFHRLTIPVTR